MAKQTVTEQRQALIDEALARMLSSRLLTVAEVSARLNLRQATIRRYIAEGRLPALRIPGGYYRIRERDLERFLQPVHKAEAR